MHEKPNKQKQSFAKFTGKHQCGSLFFIKVAGLCSAILIKKKLLPVDFSKI